MLVTAAIACLWVLSWKDGPGGGGGDVAILGPAVHAMFKVLALGVVLFVALPYLRAAVPPRAGSPW